MGYICGAHRGGRGSGGGGGWTGHMWREAPEVMGKLVDVQEALRAPYSTDRGPSRSC